MSGLTKCWLEDMIKLTIRKANNISIVRRQFIIAVLVLQLLVL